MELLLNDCSITYIPKDSKKKKHELKISHQGADALVLAVQSKEQAEQWLKVRGHFLPGVFLPSKSSHCSIAVTKWDTDSNFHVNPDHLNKSHLIWGCRNTDFRIRPRSSSQGYHPSVAAVMVFSTNGAIIWHREERWQIPFHLLLQFIFQNRAPW